MSAGGADARMAVAGDARARARAVGGGIATPTHGGTAGAAAGTGAADPAAWRSARAQAVRWDLPLLLGIVPCLVGGFWVSGAANRLSFAAWGLVAALGWFAVLRLGLARGWSGRRRTGVLLLVASAALASLVPLLIRDGASLDAGLRAIAPALAPATPGPVSTAVAAALCALAGSGLLAAARAGRPEASR